MEYVLIPNYFLPNSDHLPHCFPVLEKEERGAVRRMLENSEGELRGAVAQQGHNNMKYMIKS